MGRDGADAGGDSNAGRPGRGGRPDGYVYFNFFLPALLFSSSHSSSFPINSFAAEYNNSRGGWGAGGDRCGQRRTGWGGNGYVFCYFFCSSISSLLFSSSHSSSFPINSFSIKFNNRAGAGAARGGEMFGTDVGSWGCYGLDGWAAGRAGTDKRRV